jgi:uncharacterized membrane protein (DUF4010 family)
MARLITIEAVSAALRGPAAQPDGFVTQSLAAPDEFVPALVLALAIGMLVGIERGWAARGEPAGARVPVVRTCAMLGDKGGLMRMELGGPMAGMALILVAAAALAILAGYVGDMGRTGKLSATTSLAALVTLALGALATSGHAALASVGAGALVILLASRKALHTALRYTSEADLKALLRLAVVVFVVLPLLPDVALGPYGLNPRRLWFVVVICGAVSFVGYVLSRWLGGRRGALITACLGALVSSTVVTLESSRRIRESGRSPAHDAAIATAQAVMFARALLLVAMLVPAALAALAVLVAPATAAALVVAVALFYRSLRSPDQVEAPPVRPPGLAVALLFAVGVAAITAAAGWAGQRFGAGSAAAVVALAGMADIDSAIAAVATMPAGTLAPEIAALAIAAPILFNSLLKLSIVVGVAGPKRAPAAVGALGLAVVVLAAMLLAAGPAI